MLLDYGNVLQRFLVVYVGRTMHFIEVYNYIAMLIAT